MLLTAPSERGVDRRPPSSSVSLAGAAQEVVQAILGALAQPEGQCLRKIQKELSGALGSTLSPEGFALVAAEKQRCGELPYALEAAGDLLCARLEKDGLFPGEGGVS